MAKRKLKNTSQKAKIISLMREYLVRGDIAKLADEYGKKRQDMYNVIKGLSWRKDLIKLMHTKALENKKELEAIADSLENKPTQQN